MEIVNNIFTLQRVIQIAGVVFSFFSLILTIQLYVNLHRVVGAVKTKRNGKFQFISILLIIISILLLMVALFFL